MRMLLLILAMVIVACDSQWVKVKNGGLSKYTTEPNALPIGRQNAAMWCHNDDIYIYGGSGPFKTLGDLWKFETETSRWFWEPSPPLALHDRTKSATWSINGKMWLYGGKNLNNRVFNDLWSYHPETREWINEHTAACTPLYGMASWTHPQSNRLYMYGGKTTTTHTNAFNNHIFVFDIKTKKCKSLPYKGISPKSNAISVIGFEQDVVYLIDDDTKIYTYDIIKNTWSNLNNTFTNVPRIGENLWLTSKQNELMVFGGKYGSELFGDTWLLDIKTKEWTQQPDNGPGQRWGTSQCTNKKGSTYFFGGSFEDPTKKHNDLWKYGDLNKQNLLDIVFNLKTDIYVILAFVIIIFILLIVYGIVTWVYTCHKKKKKSENRKMLIRMSEDTSDAFEI